jgi:hypothetical protein
MKQRIENENKALVLKAFDTLFNKRDYATAERSGRPTIFNTALLSHLAVTVSSTLLGASQRP